MKKEPLWMNRRLRIGLLAGVLVIFTFYCIAWSADVITATLKITPSPNVKPGQSLKFQATIFHNPAFPQSPGTKIECWVTRHDFSWKTEDRFINYPGPGQKVTVNFTKSYTVPSDAKSGQVFDFYVVYGIWYPISEKGSVKVIELILKKDTLKIQKQKNRTIPLESR
jgi:hypothetical protein